MLRSLAEVENMRTRSERNVADARAHGQQKFAESLLEVRWSGVRVRVRLV